MRIGDMAQNHIVQQSASKGEIYGMNKRMNSEGLTGMCIHGMTSADFKMVKVPDEIKEKILNLAKSEFINKYGMTDGEELSGLSKKYIASIPESERINAGWTLGQIFLNESQRLHDIVKENYPNWKEGQPFDRTAVDKLISSKLDITV